MNYNDRPENDFDVNDLPVEQTPAIVEKGNQDNKLCDKIEDVTQNSTQNYVEEWERYFMQPQYVSYIQKQAMNGCLRSCRFRSICWRIYLDCLTENQTAWQEETNQARSRYEALKSEYITNPRIDDMAEDLSLNNPLSQAETSSWNRYFRDSELKITIRQDVIRTFPEIEFFHDPQIRDMMVNILFCYARHFPEMSYKQGMHEILAPIIFILRSDHQAFLHASEIDLLPLFDTSSRDTIKLLLDPSFIEHDSFHMFSQVMDVIEPWYLIRDVYPPQKPNSVSVRLFARPQDMNPTNVIVFKLTRIHDHLLKKHDPQLYHHLEKLEIAPQIYGIRWLRLLFGREFPVQDLLVVWDVIFADSMAFDLVDYIFVSMLIFIRDILLNGDYACCLTCLMKYPAVTDVQYIIDVALHLRDPNKHPKPCGYSTHMLQHKPTVGGRMDIHRAPVRNNSFEESCKVEGQQKSSKMTSGFSTLTKKITQRPKTLPLSQELTPGAKTTTKASSEPATFGSRSPSPTLNDCVQEIAAKSDNPNNTELKPLQAERLPSKFKNDDSEKKLNRKGSWPFKREREMKNREEVFHTGPRLQGQLHDLQAMCAYCSSKMTIQIDRLQDCMLKQNLDCEDEMLIALAGLKQVRDILKGTLKFSSNILDGDEIVINDNHYQMDAAKRDAAMLETKEACEMVEH